MVRLVLGFGIFCAIHAADTQSCAFSSPALTWITNSTVKLEQIIGDKDWAAAARGTNLPTFSQTVTRFHILGNGLGYSFEDHGKLLFLFGDTISEDQTNLNYHAADPLAWSPTSEGEAPLLLNFFTNTPPAKTTPLFVQPFGIKMGPFDVPNSGISLPSGIFLVCNTGSNADLPNPQTNDFSMLIRFDEAMQTFTTNRVLSILSTNWDPRSPLQGHFINTSMHEFGSNVLMFGTGEYRSGDIFLSMIPTATFATGAGTVYFAGLTNGQPIWSQTESNCVPVVQDNPANGPAWPNDSGTVGNVSVCFPPALGLWLMTYDGGRSADSKFLHTTGVYFTYAVEPWGPWSKPQLIFNKLRDGGSGVFIHDPSLPYDDGLDGPVIGTNSPTATPGGDFAPIMIERFTRITNSTLLVYFTMSTWNPYTVAKMRSSFTIQPQIEASLLDQQANDFRFTWHGPTNASYQVDYTDTLPPNWITFPVGISTTGGTFNFVDSWLTNRMDRVQSRFYRLRSAP